MQLEQRWEVMLQLHQSDQQYIAYLGVISEVWWYSIRTRATTSTDFRNQLTSHPNSNRIKFT